MAQRKNIPLGTLRAFEAAARLGRMTLAAEELSVTHGAISRQVRQLQIHLGVDLFEGPRSRPVLTPEGAQLLNALRPAFDQIDTAVRTVGIVDTGVLDVACYSTFAIRWLIPRLHRFQRAQPAIDIRLSTDERPPHQSRRRFDIEIMLNTQNGPSEPCTATLFPERLGVVVAPGLNPGKAALTVKGLTALPALTTRTRATAWREWLVLMDADPAAMGARKPIQFEHYTFTIEAAASGLGACVTPFHLVADDVASGRLIAPFGFIESGQFYVVRQLQRRNRSAGVFTAWLQKEAAYLQSPATRRTTRR